MYNLQRVFNVVHNVVRSKILQSIDIYVIIRLSALLPKHIIAVKMAVAG